MEQPATLDQTLFQRTCGKRTPSDFEIVDGWQANPTWGSPRIRAEMAKLGLQVSAYRIRGLATPAAIGLFSLRKLAVISKLKADDQVMEFAKLRSRFESAATR
jgi:hypothetical protein